MTTGPPFRAWRLTTGGTLQPLGGDAKAQDGGSSGSTTSATAAAADALFSAPEARRRAIAELATLAATSGHGSFLQLGPKVVARQLGAVLLTGPTPLDVTHVLQTELGMAVFEQLLAGQGLLAEGQTLESLGGGREVEGAVRTVWANCGGVLSDQVRGVFFCVAGLLWNASGDWYLWPWQVGDCSTVRLLSCCSFHERSGCFLGGDLGLCPGTGIAQLNRVHWKL